MSSPSTFLYYQTIYANMGKVNFAFLVKTILDFLQMLLSSLLLSSTFNCFEMFLFVFSIEKPQRYLNGVSPLRSFLLSQRQF
jgi:hypothetical protein